MFVSYHSNAGGRSRRHWCCTTAIHPAARRRRISSCWPNAGHRDQRRPGRPERPVRAQLEQSRLEHHLPRPTSTTARSTTRTSTTSSTPRSSKSAFHDNQLDAELMRDAKVRDAVGAIDATRASSSTSARSTATRRRSTMLPGQVTQRAGRVECGDGSVTAHVDVRPRRTPTTATRPTGYRIYAFDQRLRLRRRHVRRRRRRRPRSR